MRISLFADRRLQRNRLLCDLQNLANLPYRNVHSLRDLFARRFTPEFLHKSPRSADHFVNHLEHVRGNTDRPGLISDRACYCLAIPKPHERNPEKMTFTTASGLLPAGIAVYVQREPNGVHLETRYPVGLEDLTSLWERGRSNSLRPAS